MRNFPRPIQVTQLSVSAVTRWRLRLTIAVVTEKNQTTRATIAIQVLAGRVSPSGLVPSIPVSENSICVGSKHTRAMSMPARVSIHKSYGNRFLFDKDSRSSGVNHERP